MGGEGWLRGRRGRECVGGWVALRDGRFLWIGLGGERGKRRGWVGGTRQGQGGGEHEDQGQGVTKSCGLGHERGGGGGGRGHAVGKDKKGREGKGRRKGTHTFESYPWWSLLIPS